MIAISIKKEPFFRIMGKGYPRLMAKPEPVKKPNKFFCWKCYKYHFIYSNIGNDHKGYPEG